MGRRIGIGIMMGADGGRDADAKWEGWGLARKGKRGPSRRDERRDGGWGSYIKLFFFFNARAGAVKCTVRTEKVDGTVLVVC